MITECNRAIPRECEEHGAENRQVILLAVHWLDWIPRRRGVKLMDLRREQVPSRPSDLTTLESRPEWNVILSKAVSAGTLIVEKLSMPAGMPAVPVVTVHGQ